MTFRLTLNHNRWDGHFVEELGMMGPWRSLVMAAALTAAADVAVAQTVMVRNAPQGSTVELLLNGTTVGSVPAKPGGETIVVVPASARLAGKAEMDVRLWVETCGEVRRVLMVEAGLWPAPKETSCDRREIPGVFWARAITTFVVDVAGLSPSVWLRQGAVPAEWLGKGPTIGPERPTFVARTGLMLSAGGGLRQFGTTASIYCGDVTPCTGDKARETYSAGGTFWIAKFLAVDANFVKPGSLELAGRPTGFSFDTTVNVNLYTYGLKAGLPIGRFRFYVLGGGNYMTATTTTTQTIADRTVTVDGVDQTLTGGTQTSTVKTSGWGFQVGAGVEFWVSSKFGFYAEGTRAWLKGKPANSSDLPLDDHLTYYVLGGRLRLGR